MPSEPVRPVSPLLSMLATVSFWRLSTIKESASGVAAQLQLGQYALGCCIGVGQTGNANQVEQVDAVDDLAAGGEQWIERVGELAVIGGKDRAAASAPPEKVFGVEAGFGYRCRCRGQLCPAKAERPLMTLGA